MRAENFKMDEQTAIDKSERPLHIEDVKMSSKVNAEVVYSSDDFRRIRRKLDLWLMPVMMFTYGLQ